MLKFSLAVVLRKDKRYKEEVAKQIAKLETDFNDHDIILTNMVVEKHCDALHGKKALQLYQKDC